MLLTLPTPSLNKTSPKQIISPRKKYTDIKTEKGKEALHDVHLRLHQVAQSSWWSPGSPSWPTECGAPQSWVWYWNDLLADSPLHIWCSNHWHCEGCLPRSEQRQNKNEAQSYYSFFFFFAIMGPMGTQNIVKLVNQHAPLLFASVHVKPLISQNSPPQDANLLVGLWSLG